jgi:hypothetical protein
MGLGLLKLRHPYIKNDDVYANKTHQLKPGTGAGTW